MTTTCEIILITLSFLIVAVCLMQSGKSEGASAAVMGGNKMNIFTRTKERGPEKIMTIITAVLVIAFFIVATLCSFGL